VCGERLSSYLTEKITHPPFASADDSANSPNNSRKALLVAKTECCGFSISSPVAVGTVHATSGFRFLHPRKWSKPFALSRSTWQLTAADSQHLQQKINKLICNGGNWKE
jgi:hypothetical protein